MVAYGYELIVQNNWTKNLKARCRKPSWFAKFVFENVSKWKNFLTDTGATKNKYDDLKKYHDVF